MPRTSKLDNAIHFIVSRCQPNELGAVKLNKILWFSDCSHFERFGSPITGDEYVKRQYGPVPKNVLQSTRGLESDGKIAIREVDVYGKLKREFWSLASPDLSEFTADEVSIIDQMIEWIAKSHTAQSISDHSHDMVWESADMGEVIPFGAALANRSAEITEDDIDWAMAELAKAS